LSVVCFVAGFGPVGALLLIESVTSDDKRGGGFGGQKKRVVVQRSRGCRKKGGFERWARFAPHQTIKQGRRRERGRVSRAGLEEKQEGVTFQNCK
jgi:hypothetical protein